jgi:hypothetical protein
VDHGLAGAQRVGESEGRWDSYGYLKRPESGSIGICCSGGGVRSASFSLGGLQVLREEHWLEDADYLSCVSGGGYISIAHAVLTSETIKHAPPPSPERPHDPEDAIFGGIPPWAPGSPEEQHLRDRLSYLTPGVSGRLWAGLNLVYGLVKTLLPFLAVLYLAGFIVGFALTRWLGPALRFNPSMTPGVDPWFGVQTTPFVWTASGLVLVAAAALFVRRRKATKEGADGWMFSLQYLAIAAVGLGVGVLAFLVLLPLTLHSLHAGLLRTLTHAVVTAPILVGAGGIGGLVTRLAKVESSKWFRFGLRILVVLSTPILIVFPIVGFTFWSAQWGRGSHDLVWRVGLAGAAIAILAVNAFLDDVTPVAHLFYRDRLATAFVGYRAREDAHPGRLIFAQMPWGRPLEESELERGSTATAKMPELLVCAAVNLSADVPVGRLAAPFTFERDWSGSPVTGYVPTAWLEQASQETATLPAMMAISGAAVSPSMGKMTRPALRFVMTMLDVRLGVWLPNPFRTEPTTRRTAAELRRDRRIPTTPSPNLPTGFAQKAIARLRKPGSLYLFREALGMNGLSNEFVYISDGGHWENLGLVELLRRGCTDVVCIDGSGGDAVSLGTLSQAIALARSDLGIEITFAEGVLEALRSDENGLSKSGFARGTIVYPGKSDHGRLLYIRTVIPTDAPEDVRTFSARDHRFPNHSTADQFFNDAVFESYRALGRHNTLAAIRSVASKTDSATRGQER